MPLPYTRVKKADLEILERDILGLIEDEPEAVSALAAFRAMLPAIEQALAKDADPNKIYEQLKAKGVITNQEDFWAHVKPIMVRLDLIAETKPKPKRKRRSTAARPPSGHAAPFLTARDIADRHNEPPPPERTPTAVVTNRPVTVHGDTAPPPVPPRRVSSSVTAPVKREGSDSASPPADGRL